MKIALAQYEVFRGNPKANVTQIGAFAREAKEQEAAALFLPEMATTGFDWKRNFELLNTATEVIREIANIAREKQIAICGSFLEKTECGAAANTLYFIDTNGCVLAKYRKVHLFTLFHEERYVEAGNELVVASTEIGQIGCAVCYDLRFPELFMENTLAGAGLHVLPAAFPHPRLDHWQTLIRARAIENQSFLIATNQCGREEHGGSLGAIQYFGHSMVVDPWGTVLFEAGEVPGLHVVEIDSSEVDRIRNHLTALRDRRPEIYQTNSTEDQ